MFSRFLVLMALLCGLLSGCSALPGQPVAPQANMPNPASVHCTEQGGRLEIRQDASGGQYGVCIFQDGSECDEWALFRDECQPGEFTTAPSPASQPVYTNDDYGFSFNPPNTWTVEGQQNQLKFRQGNYILWVQYFWADETPTLVPTPEQTLHRLEATPASLLGQSLPKWLLVDQGKVKRLEYGPNIAIARLRLVIWLDYDQTLPIDPGEFEMPENIITQADGILASFSLTSGETPALITGAP